MIRPLPYTAPSGRFHSSIRIPQWISSDSLVYLAELLFYEGPPFFRRRSTPVRMWCYLTSRPGPRS